MNPRDPGFVPLIGAGAALASSLSRSPETAPAAAAVGSGPAAELRLGYFGNIIVLIGTGAIIPSMDGARRLHRDANQDEGTFGPWAQDFLKVLFLASAIWGITISTLTSAIRSGSHNSGA